MELKKSLSLLFFLRGVVHKLCYSFTYLISKIKYWSPHYLWTAILTVKIFVINWIESNFNVILNIEIYWGCSWRIIMEFYDNYQKIRSRKLNHDGGCSAIMLLFWLWVGSSKTRGPLIFIEEWHDRIKILSYSWTTPVPGKI